MTNVGLLRRTLEHIKENPESWDQYSYGYESECGMRGCFAGWACVLSGMEFARDRNGDMTGGIVPQTVPEAIRDWASAEEERGGYVGISEAAREVLGLRLFEAQELFYGGNRLENLEAVVEELCGGA